MPYNMTYKTENAFTVISWCFTVHDCSIMDALTCDRAIVLSKTAAICDRNG